ncbi:MAG: AAA family ATPase [Eubacterium ramulus]
MQVATCRFRHTGLSAISHGKRILHSPARRRADYILKDRPDTYHIFVYGDEYEKISRTQQLFNLSEKDARAMNRDMDKKRRLHYEYYTDRKWGDPQNHCMCLNTSALDTERCIRYILDLFE